MWVDTGLARRGGGTEARRVAIKLAVVAVLDFPLALALRARRGRQRDRRRQSDRRRRRCRKLGHALFRCLGGETGVGGGAHDMRAELCCVGEKIHVVDCNPALTLWGAAGEPRLDLVDAGRALQRRRAHDNIARDTDGGKATREKALAEVVVAPGRAEHD